MLRRDKRKRVTSVRTWWEIQLDQPFSRSFLQVNSNEKINQMIQQDDRLWIKVTLAIATLLRAPTDLVRLIVNYWVENPSVLPQRSYLEKDTILPLRCLPWLLQKDLSAGNIREALLQLDFHFSNMDFSKLWVETDGVDPNGQEFLVVSRVSPPDANLFLILILHPISSKPIEIQGNRDYVVKQSIRSLFVKPLSSSAQEDGYRCEKFSEVYAYFESTFDGKEVVVHFVHA